MRKSTLRSTTSLVVSFSLIASPIFAQTVAVEAEGEPTLCVGLDPLDDAGIAVDTEVDPDAEPVLPCFDTDGALITDQAALDAALAAQVEAVNTPAPAEDDAPAATDVAEGDAAEVAVEEPAEPAEPVETEEAEVEGTEEPVVMESETAEAEIEAEVATSNEAEVTVQDETTAEADTAAEGEANDVIVSEGVPEGDDTDVVVTEGLPEGESPVVTDRAATAEDTIVVDDTPAAAAAAEDDEENAAGAEVVVEELTEEDVRASDEDFATAATGDTEAASSSDDSSGMSDFERALLIGLGAVVVGSVMNNGDEVVSNSGDRVVVRRNDELVVLKDDDVLLRQPGSQVETRSFDDGSTRTVVTRADGTQIITIRAGDGRVLRRTRIMNDGSEFVLFDDTQQAEPIDVTELPANDRASVQMQASQSDVDTLRLALLANQTAQFDRSYSLRQIRQIEEVRALAPEVELDVVTFATGSAAIQPSQAEELTNLGLAIANIIEEDPSQVFLIEGHTDAVGDAGYNLSLSDRRAETVALAMTEYFGIPPENLITQGYGESTLKVQTLRAERANRRASVRNITSLLR